MNKQCKVSEQSISRLKPTSTVNIYFGEVTSVLQDDSTSFEINHCWQAMPAAGLLVSPIIQDQVMFVEIQSQYYITQVLHRRAVENTIELKTENDLHISANNFRVVAKENMDFVSLQRISLQCKQGVLSMTHSLITQAEHFIQNAAHLSLTAKSLLRLHGKQQIITAKDDVRIDGKRINMG